MKTLFAYKVLEQGAPTIVDAWEIASGLNVKAVMLRMKDMHDFIWNATCDNGIPVLQLAPNDDDDDLTQVTFPTMQGWGWWCHQTTKDTVYLCFVRNEKTS